MGGDWKEVGRTGLLFIIIIISTNLCLLKARHSTLHYWFLIHQHRFNTQLVSTFCCFLKNEDAYGVRPFRCNFKK